MQGPCAVLDGSLFAQPFPVGMNTGIPALLKNPNALTPAETRTWLILCSIPPWLTFPQDHLGSSQSVLIAITCLLSNFTK